MGSVPPPSGQGLGRRQRTPSRGPPRPAPTGSSTGRPGCSPRPRALRSAAPPQQPFLPTPRAPPVQFRSLERAGRSCPLEQGQEGARRSPQFRVACGRRPPPDPHPATPARGAPLHPGRGLTCLVAPLASALPPQPDCSGRENGGGGAGGANPEPRPGPHPELHRAGPEERERTLPARSGARVCAARPCLREITGAAGPVPARDDSARAAGRLGQGAAHT